MLFFYWLIDSIVLDEIIFPRRDKIYVRVLSVITPQFSSVEIT